MMMMMMIIIIIIIITRFVIVRAELLGLEIRPGCGAQLARVGEMIKVATREPEFEMSRNLSFSTSILSSDKDKMARAISYSVQQRAESSVSPDHGLPWA